jgi:hypothetical protein
MIAKCIIETARLGVKDVPFESNGAVQYNKYYF